MYKPPNTASRGTAESVVLRGGVNGKRDTNCKKKDHHTAVQIVSSGVYGVHKEFNSSNLRSSIIGGVHR